MTNETEQSILKMRSNTGGGLVTTSFRDDYISKGNSFANETIREVLTDGATQYFVLDPTNCTCARVFKLPISVVSSTGYVTVKLYEGTDYTGVNALTFINRDRNSTTTLKTTLKDLATDGGGGKGTLLFYTLFGTSETRQSSGGGAGSSANVILLDMTKKYLFEVYNESACLIGYNVELVEV